MLSTTLIRSGHAHPVLQWSSAPVFATPCTRAFRSEAGDGTDLLVLLVQSSDMLSSGSCDWQQLQSLPQATLVSLLKRGAQELKARKELAEQQRYYVDPPSAGRRVAQPEGPWPSDPQEQKVLQDAYHQRIEEMERLLEDVRSKWQTQPVEGLRTPDLSIGSKYPTELRWNMDTRSFTLDYGYKFPVQQRLSMVISSALLLYRIICLFKVEVDTTTLTDRYKCVWAVRLWHTATGRELILTEHKGAAEVWLEWPNVEDKQLSSEFLQLMDLLCGECPHTYDWTLAGSVA